MSTSTPTVLTDRSPNTSPKKSTMNADTKPIIAADAPKSMEYHRQMLKERLNSDSGKQTYISPSDTIMSPCTKKLSEVKGRRFGKAKPQSLFAKAPLPADSAAVTKSADAGEGVVGVASKAELDKGV